MTGLWRTGGLLNLFGAPACDIGLAHVARGLNRGDELENGVSDTDNADDTSSDVAEDVAAEEQGAEEDID